jgi:hypothetical protein
MTHRRAGPNSARRRKISGFVLTGVVLAITICATLGPGNAFFLEEKRFGRFCNDRTRACQLRASLVGAIVPQDAARLSQAIQEIHRQAAAAKWDVDPPYLKLDTPGGDVTVAMTIGRLLRQEQAYVHIERDAKCLSACVLILAGAVNREMQGAVGIHRPYFEVPAGPIAADKINEVYQDMLQKMHLYFREMNVSEQLADAMLRIEPEDMHVLNAASLNNYGLVPKDPVAKETSEIKKAKRLGLIRAEYMRRKELASTICGNSTTICYQRVLETGKEDPGVSRDQVDFSQYGRPLQPNQ